MSRYAVGIGARPGVPAEAVAALLDRVLAEHGLDPADAVYATVDARAGEPGLRRAGLIGFTAAELAAVPVPHPSPRVATAVGTASVAEAAALLAARGLPGGGPGAVLVVPKTAGEGVTVAVARPAR